jgi:hypothetical protein
VILTTDPVAGGLTRPMRRMILHHVASDGL